MGSDTKDTVVSRCLIAITNEKDVAFALPQFISNFLQRHAENRSLGKSRVRREAAGRRSSLDISLAHFRALRAACFKGIVLDLLSRDFLADKPAAAEDGQLRAIATPVVSFYWRLLRKVIM
ncbi:uncharacterized protein ACIB01_015159 isoform 1-T1 [Guaruba guarouba]